MKNLFLLLLLNVLSVGIFAQFITLTPAGAGGDDSVVLTFDATQGNGELVGASKVYMHHVVVTSSPTGTAWQHVIGNWGQDDGIGEMTPVAGQANKWQLAFTPSVRAYFNVPAGENIFRISGVFRSADGSTKGTIAPGSYGWGTSADNLDLYVNLNNANYLQINAPLTDESFVFQGQPITISATASSPVTSMKIWIDAGSGFVQRAAVTSGTTIQNAYFPAASGNISIKFTATINGEDLEIVRQHSIVILPTSVIQPLPAGVQAGINYNAADPTRATLVLQAPGKAIAYVVGDFNNWTTQAAYQMKKTPDGEFFWLELTGLSPGQPYVFQYWVDGTIKIGDPYADQVADPWNDSFIDAATYPGGLPAYDHPEFGVATVLQTGQTPYTWAASENTWQRPDINHAVIYELLIRDFIGDHTYKGLRDTLAYIRNLGVDAIEIMPFNEFEGNESWGYNPNYFFATDKYYGPKEEVKRLIEAAHQEGLAVIMDMVMNHAYGTNPMVKLYFDQAANKPAANNPWFNREYVGQYQWGYDWNHESAYTQAFLDRLNAYWIEEFHIDGYRFDFTKGFTNYAPGGSVDGFDQSRINILERMADALWDVDPDAYIILEHWSPQAEEQILGNYGMKMWANRSYDFVPAVTGTNTGSFQNLNATTHVQFFDSHDEQRIAWHALNESLANGNYDGRNPLIAYERLKQAAAFAFLSPGPKMIWQFDELGYNIDINFNGRVGNKPLPWGPDGLGYYEDPLRRYIYDAYRGILDVRREIGPANLASATVNHKFTGETRRLSYDMSGTDLVLIGNFGLAANTINPAFTQTGTWYDYFSGETIDVTSTTANRNLEAGEWHIYTTTRLSDGLPDVVATYSNPVTITPYPFTQNQEITIRFEARKAFPGETAGLVGAEKVYIHSGVVLDPGSDDLSNVVGNLVDDGVGLMTEVSDDIWEITLTPAAYYSLTEDQEALKLGMTFRNEDNTNVGLGFRNSVIYFNVESDDPFVTIEPAAFTIDDPITITFNAQRGNRELVGANKVYFHSSVDLTDTTTPWNTGWNNVVGNWGQDDGVGQMTQVPGQPNKWQITLTPRSYYGLNTGDVVYWIPAVFRNANGSIKGTGTPGPIESGLIHTTQDFFLRNQLIVGTDDALPAGLDFQLYPNPAKGSVQVVLGGFVGDYQLQVLDLTGRPLHHERLQLNGFADQQHTLQLGSMPAGMYLVRLIGDSQTVTRELVKW